MREHDPHGRRLPIKIDTASNGEHFPIPLLPEERAIKRMARERIDGLCTRLGTGRRSFMKTLCAAAATLLACNEIWAAAGGRGGFFNIPEAAAAEEEAAAQALAGDEFIMDMQTHCVDPSGDWAKGEDGKRWARNLTSVFSQSEGYEGSPFQAYSAEQMIKEVFLDSDTDIAVISALWGGAGQNPTPMKYADKARKMITDQIGEHRGLIHGGVLPNEAGQLDFMNIQAKRYNVDAWKLYPQWGPDGVGFFMDDERYGIPMLERARELGVTIVASHRGLPLPGLEYKYSHPADIARAARQFPDLTFLCYHSGFEPGVVEGPYNPQRDRGVDRFIRAFLDQGFEPNQGNVYAELGSVWRHYMTKQDQAAHLMGKLLKYLGEDRICWGTDAIWYGSPQDQIQAMRAFTISEEFQERYGYPALTSQAKRKIFGENAARLHAIDMARVSKTTADDALQRRRAAYRQNPNPSFVTYGPKTRREFAQLLTRTGGRPG